MLGVVTIGQTPRPDLQRAFEAHAGGVTVSVRGALDGLDPAAIDALAAGPTDYPLLVRLADGGTREVPREAILPHVAEQARELARLGARVVAVACAGDFPAFACDVPVLLPGRLLPAVVSAATAERRVGVVAPIRSQVLAARRKWVGDGFDPVVTWASPAAPEEVEAASLALRDADVALVVLDCFGFDEDAARAVAARTGKLVLAAQPLTARIAGAMVAGSREPGAGSR